MRPCIIRSVFHLLELLVMLNRFTELYRNMNKESQVWDAGGSSWRQRTAASGKLAPGRVEDLALREKESVSFNSVPETPRIIIRGPLMQWIFVLPNILSHYMHTSAAYERPHIPCRCSSGTLTKFAKSKLLLFFFVHNIECIGRVAYLEYGKRSNQN